VASTSALTNQNWRGGPKLQQKVNLRGLKRDIFFRGPKSQLWET